LVMLMLMLLLDGTNVLDTWKGPAEQEPPNTPHDTSLCFSLLFPE